MPERDAPQKRVKNLLAQDRELSETQMKEFRMQMEEKLELYERSAKRTRRRFVLAATVYCLALTAYTLGVTLFGGAAGEGGLGRWRQLVFIPIAGSMLAAAVIAILLAGLYVFRYLPQLSRTRFDLQTTMLLELQQRVAELREQIARRGG